MEKEKILWTIGIILIVVGAAAVILRFGLGGDEDTWLCDNSQWVKHGNPSAPTPTSGCGQESNGGLANPASVNCVNEGGILEIRNDEIGGQYGICKFSDGSECEEWKFFRGECQRENNR
ncbi:MAG: DUF333 domain-containing protein [Patescibacteria group bacterium]